MVEIKRILKQSLRQLFGNKLYMREIDSLIERVDLKPEEVQALRYLINDMRNTQSMLSRQKTNPRIF